MKIHYNKENGPEKIITGVTAIQVVDQTKPVTALLENGKELTISLNNIEMTFDEGVFDTKSKDLAKENEKLKLCLFAVIMNSKVAPVGERLGKTIDEITDMTVDTIKEVYKGIDGLSDYYKELLGDRRIDL